MAVPFGAVRLQGCRSLRAVCCIRRCNAEHPTPQRTTLAAEGNKLSSCPTMSPKICGMACISTPKAGAILQLANTSDGRHDVRYPNEMRSMLDQARFSFVRLAPQPVSTMCAQLRVGQPPISAVLGSRLPGSLIRGLCCGGGGYGVIKGRGPGSTRMKHSGRSPERSNTRGKRTRLHPQLERCQTLDDWCDFINTSVGQLDASNTAGAFKVLARMKSRGRNDQLREPLLRLSKHASAIAGEMTANQIEGIYWAHGKMKKQRMHEPLWEEMGKVAIASVDKFSAKNVVNTVWSLAKTKRKGTLQINLVAAMSERAKRIAETFNDQDVASVMYSLAEMELVADAGLVAAMSERAKRIAKEFNSQGVANLMWAIGTMGLVADAGLVAAMSERAKGIAEEFTSQGVANLMWAIGTMGLVADAGLVSAMSERAKRIAEEFNSQGVANLMQAFGKMGLVADAGLVAAMSERAKRIAEEFNSQEVASLMWAIGKMGLVADAGLVSAMSERAKRIAEEFNSQGVANLMQAFGAMGLVADAGLVAAMSERAKRIAEEFNSQEVANLMWAFGKMGLVADAGLVGAMSERAKRIAEEFNSQGVANLMWAFGTMGLVADAGLVGAMSERAKRIAEEFNSQDVANLMWALSVCDEKALFVVFEDCRSFSANHYVWNEMQLRQLHQTYITIKLSSEFESRASASLLSLMSDTSIARNEAIRRASSNPSRMQEQVAHTLSSMGLDVREEVIDEESGYSLDIVLDRASPLAPEYVGKCKAGWAVEVDGPWHFGRSSDGALHCNGGTLLKRRHLEQLGYAVVSVPFWEWNKVEKNPKERVRFLSEKLELRPTSRKNAE